MTEQEGPSVVVIPEQRYNSCVGCKWLDKTLWKSGREPEYRCFCTHPVWSENSRLSNGVRDIQITVDHKVEVPEWCPVLSEDEGYQTTDKSEGGAN